MARYRGPVLKRCSSLGLSPQAVGVFKESNRRNDKRQKKLSEYGTQLREKQKAKFFYGMQEKQFRSFFNRAAKMPGQAGENLHRLLELRMDNIVYRLGFAATRREARQMVVHGHFLLNGKSHDVPSTCLKIGDVVEVREKSKNHPRIKECVSKSIGAVRWLSFDPEAMKGTVVENPIRELLDFELEERLIVEFYSK